MDTDIFDLVRKNKIFEVGNLVNSGINVNLKNSEGVWLLSLSSYLGRTEIVKLLLEHGADVNVTDKDRLSVPAVKPRLFMAGI